MRWPWRRRRYELPEWVLNDPLFLDLRTRLSTPITPEECWKRASRGQEEHSTEDNSTQD